MLVLTVNVVVPAGACHRAGQRPDPLAAQPCAIFSIGRSMSKRGRKRKMPAYWVARSKINDPVEYKKYTDRVPAIIARYGGKVLARGGRFQVMEGPHKSQRFVVIEFPTFEQGVACFTSKEYDEAAAFRRTGAGEVETVIVDGAHAT